jgi:hypothetical protein
VGEAIQADVIIADPPWPVRTNRVAIILSVSSLGLLIDDRLSSLRNERPNDPDTQAARDEAIAHYEILKRTLDHLRSVASQLESGQRPDQETLKKAAITFGEGVQNFWNKAHEKICQTAFDVGIFTSCVGLCSLLGSGGEITATIAGALVGGRTVVDALNALSKRKTKARRKQ